MHRAALSYTAERAVMTDDQVVRTWSALIDRVARRISARTANTIAPGDLWSAGALGLIEAYHRFDPARAVKFESFAEHRIRGAMIDELREMDHLPRRLRADADRVRKARHQLASRLGRDPTTEELGAHLGMSWEDVETLESLGQPVMPLQADAPLPSGEQPQDEQIDHLARVQFVTRAIEKLPPRLQLVLSLHYVEGLTYKEIGEALEVSEARICQIHGEAIKKVRVVLAEEGVEGP
jgi:RNA polymerase sigma factor for flagellar operon FliA